MYAELVGERWQTLPREIRALHAPGRIRGSFRVRRGRGVAGAIARAFGFPPDGDAVPVTLTITREGNRWHWRRRFGEIAVESWQEPDGTRLREGFRGFVCLFEPRVEDDAFALLQCGARLRLGALEMPLPRSLQPRIAGRVAMRAGRAFVSVRIDAPFVGRVVEYEGEARPAEEGT